MKKRFKKPFSGFKEWYRNSFFELWREAEHNFRNLFK